MFFVLMISVIQLTYFQIYIQNKKFLQYVIVLSLLRILFYQNYEKILDFNKKPKPKAWDFFDK
ncbi:hypothetical protein DP065_02710 [[Mycoplasma] anseris]|uniref:Uncharacterized protein n=1 Tax=[Mycoplasma] anseris TaxID=92400 RepID=A0A2Z4NDH9_9BACT|nr:hypothetical protein DP065_02710 [[Mycoplasma] anseris]